MCLSAQTHAGWMGTGKHLETAKKESMDSKSSSTLIEQSLEAQTTLIEHSNPTPFEKLWIRSCTKVFLVAFI